MPSICKHIKTSLSIGSACHLTCLHGEGRIEFEGPPAMITNYFYEVPYAWNQIFLGRLLGFDFLVAFVCSILSNRFSNSCLRIPEPQRIVSIHLHWHHNTRISTFTVGNRYIYMNKKSCMLVTPHTVRSIPSVVGERHFLTTSQTCKKD